MKIKNHEVTFSTGKVMYAHQGIIGIDDELNVTDGYDGGFDCLVKPEDCEDWLTKEEQIELAEHMIKKWGEFKRKAERAEDLE